MALRAYPVPDREAGESGRKAAEHRLLDRLDELDDEAIAARDKWLPPKVVEDGLRIFRGDLRPKGRDPYFATNFVEAFIDRMVAQLTDNRPIVRVEQRKAGLRAMAATLQIVIRAVWDETAMQRQTWKMCQMAGSMASAAMYTGYDPTGDEIYLEVLSNRQLRLDPAIREAALIDQHAEYLFIERVRPLDDLRARFPGRGAEVQADVSVLDDEATVRARTLLSPLKDLAARFRGGSRNGADAGALPRARVTECFLQDRQTEPGGQRLFPAFRRIVRTRDVILKDEPNAFWDGRIPVDLFDWATDPEHPWGMSEPEGLRYLQGGFNQLGDGLVENQLLTNFIQFVADYDAVDEKVWKFFQAISNSIVIRKKNRNATIGIVPPPAFGADKLGLMRFIFTQAQLKTGVTDVTLGEHPGSLQSGIAIEGLQEGASLMNRSRQSRLEDFYARVGQKLIARIIQFMPADRLVGLVGPTPDALQAAMNRTEFFIDDAGKPLDETARREAFRYLRFAVLPGSSRPGTRQNRAKLMMDLQRDGIASRLDVAEAAEIPDAEAMIARADKDRAAMAASMPQPPPK